MASIVDLTAENKETIIQNNKIVVLDFWSNGCGPCTQLSKTIDKIALDIPSDASIVFAKVRVDTELDLARDYRIRSVPTIVIIKDGHEVERKISAITESVLMGMIEKVI